MTVGNSPANNAPQLASRPLRLVAPSESPAAPSPSALAPPSPTLRRLQRDLAEALAEARSLRELLEELPSILERKFQQRLRALLLEQRQLERENALLQRHLVALISGGPAELAPSPALPEARGGLAEPAADPSRPATLANAPALSDGLGLRRALRRLHR
jgi:hypothetical protein